MFFAISHPSESVWRSLTKTILLELNNPHHHSDPSQLNFELAFRLYGNNSGLEYARLDSHYTRDRQCHLLSQTTQRVINQ